jgi:hypothetical protein
VSWIWGLRSGDGKKQQHSKAVREQQDAERPAVKTYQEMALANTSLHGFVE